MEATDWDRYGTGNYEKCADCMVHSGFEATAVADTVKRPLKALAVTLRGHDEARWRPISRSTDDDDGGGDGASDDDGAGRGGRRRTAGARDDERRGAGAADGGGGRARRAAQGGIFFFFRGPRRVTAKAFNGCLTVSATAVASNPLWTMQSAHFS